jgi:hypothetical protein
MTEGATKRDRRVGGISTRAASWWLAWSLGGLSLAMFVASVVLFVLARSAPVPSSWGVDFTVGGLWGVPFLAFPLVGALIASKRPDNPIGWILLADGLLWMFLFMNEYYGIYGVAKPGSVNFPVGMAGLSNWLWVPAGGLLGTYLLLLFPDGNLPSRRWRLLAWLSGAVIVLLSAAVALAPGPLQNLGGVRNPFGLEKAAWVGAAYIVIPLLPLCVLASAMSLVLRYRRSTGELREQIKWMAFAASFVGLVPLFAVASSLFFTSEETWSSRASTMPTPGPRCQTRRASGCTSRSGFGPSGSTAGSVTSWARGTMWGGGTFLYANGSRIPIRPPICLRCWGWRSGTPL